MKLLYSLLVLLCAVTLLPAQQPTSPPAKPVTRCRVCVRRVVRVEPAGAPIPSPSPATEFFVGEARVEVTKDETVVRLAMAQHGSVLIELPANDGPRYIIPGDPEMATVDQKALERNKRAIIVRPGAQFLPPLRNLRARTPAATVTAQMRSGLVVTFLFYPVADLAQNVHRCVLTYNRDEVIARRRAAGLPVNLASDGGSGEMTPQPAAPTSISVEDPAAETTKPKAATETSSSPSSKSIDMSEAASKPLLTAVAALAPASPEKKESLNDRAAAAARDALQSATKQPKQFKNWTKPVHGLALSILQPSAQVEGFNLVIVAIKNKTSGSLKLSPGVPDLSVEMLDENHQTVNIEALKKIAAATSEASEVIPAGACVYYAVAFVSPVLNTNQQVKITVGQTNAADKPVSIVLPASQR